MSLTTEPREVPTPNKSRRPRAASWHRPSQSTKEKLLRLLLLLLLLLLLSNTNQTLKKKKMLS
jgi:hypothetical protein